jgi:6-phosphofructokinase (EC 2.7.1.11)
MLVNRNSGYEKWRESMTNKVKKIGILTGGGDCPGLNAVIRAVTKAAIANYGYEVIGYKFGYRGLYDNDFIKLDTRSVSGILHKGGTILYSSNKDNLFNYQVEENGQCVKKDVSDVAVENMKKEEVDVLVVLGGDGTLTSARDFARKGVNIIGVPKTIDNDLSKTDVSFGFNSAVDVVVDALDKLHTTAESHHRIMILEVMGRNAGWIALHGGIAGSADVILIPEIPFSLDAIIAKMNERSQRGLPFSIIVVSEGAMERGGELTVQKMVNNSPDPVRLGGIGNKLALALEARISDHEIRNTVLGHLQRGGITSAYDRLLSTRYGVAAVELIAKGKFGSMVALQDGKMTDASLEAVIGKNKQVDVDSELIRVAKSLGVSFGEQ